MRRVIPFLLWSFLAGGPAVAVDLTLPAGASQTLEVIREADTVRLPTGPHSGTDVPNLRLEGRIVSRAWRMPVQGVTTLQLLTPLRDQLEGAGWEAVFACEALDCGGFDFRFALPTLPAPDMFLDLFDYRYLLLRRGMGATQEHAALIVSQSGRTGYVQVLEVTTLAEGYTVQPIPAEEREALPRVDLVQALQTQGHAVLEGLDFGLGDNALGAGPYRSLVTLAEFLTASPETRVALVGHSDSIGGLEQNSALSRARAEAVLNLLVEQHGVSPAQVEAHGIGYLSPIASNTSPEGRERNRRVEVVLLDAEPQ
ncbi:OmpA domain protein [Roseovarius sp. EC-HK134]|uniref:OmpA family protein n=1 Tax=unclassified Roseovarius TaxID=2614913 RepID=UPI001253DCFF|nr:MULTISPECIES: OmpA family protein [unclassified Roseovarius]VVS97600.1 OmpA domain protein [Roseovarius sp. EC-HK134]VVS99294.1 OmpA domain protein [Roseovarius sp. EC-SD190]